jgi:hypothetical protein
VTSPLRCGRLDDHPAHDWTLPGRFGKPPTTFHCRGHVVTEGYLAEYARVADKRDPEREEFSDWVREGWSA